MEKRNEIILVASFLIVLAVILVANISFLQITYYSSFDMFGSLSVYTLASLAQLSLPILFMIVLLRVRKTSPIILLIPFMLLIAVRYIGIELADVSYITSFYDAVTHFRKGLYVAIAGHSSPKFDVYFDMQPGFFWVTGMLLNVCGEPTSLVDSMSILILKWFPIFAIMVYTPILYLFYKQLLGNPLLVSLALFLNFGMEIVMFHYTAQSYGRVIYWLVLTIIFSSIKRRDSRFSFLALLSGISLIFVHLGLMILTILAFTALVVYSAPFKVLDRNNRFFHKKFIILPTTLCVAWISYLIYITRYQLGTVVRIIRRVIETLMMEGLEIFPSGITRANMIWEQIVSYKAIYIFILMALGLILSFVNAYRKRDESDKLAFSILLFSTAFFGIAAVALGGAGYIERLLSMMLPIIVYSMVKYASCLKLYKPKRFTSLLVQVSLIILIFTGSAFYMSGRNFKSVTYGEYYSRAFLVNHDPQNIMDVYSSLKVTSIRDAIESELENKFTSQITIINVERTKLIVIYYYIHADMSFINDYIINLHDEMAVIYSNPDAVIFLRTDYI